MNVPVAPLGKRLMRAVWTALPRTGLTYNCGKLLTRTLLRPAAARVPVPVQFAGRIPMTLDLGSFVANDLYCLDDHYESTTLRLWRDLARQSRTILDVGSHIGTFALVAAEANPQAQIVAVEADLGNYRLLEAHCAGFRNITPVHAAIADRPMPMWFCQSAGNDGGGYLSVDKPADTSAVEVATWTLAGLCQAQQIGAIDLMKLDVEGFEHVLLTRDDPEFWSTHAPAHLIIELTIDKHNRQRTDVLFAAMQRRGYRVERIQGLYAVPWGKPTDLANWHFHRPGN
jgi:FkbM family methyltransferase